jgi:hypothetical protein
MIKFPSIGQFKDAIKEVKYKATHLGVGDDGEQITDYGAKLPTLFYHGTVKLHGTNSSIVITPDGEIIPQSRNRVLSLDNDNFGFAKFVIEEVGEDIWNKMSSNLRKLFKISDDDSIVIYGELCGGNIQKGVALSKLPEMFVIFASKIVNGEFSRWLNLDFPINVEVFQNYHPKIKDINEFPGYSLYIDFEKPSAITNQLVEWTNSVEKECPVAHQLGSDGVGEGIVWKCLAPGYSDSRFLV